MARARLYMPLAIFSALAALFFIGLMQGDPTRLPSALMGRALPAFTLAAVVDGNAPLRHSDMGRPALLNIWASWCAPCRAEHPYLMQLAKQDVMIYGVNYKDSPAAARRFLTRYGTPYRLNGRDPDGRAALDLGVYGVPETFLIDADGRIAYRHVGPLTPQIIVDEIMPRLGGQK